MDYSPWGCKESDMTEPLSLITFTGASPVAQMVKNPLAMQEAQVRSLGWEDSPGEGNTNPLQYSCLENSTDRGAWQSTVHGVAKNQTGLSDQHFHFLSAFALKTTARIKTQTLSFLVFREL